MEQPGSVSLCVFHWANGLLHVVLFMMASRKTRPGNPDRGWNDPPMFDYIASGASQTSPRRTLLNKRVAYPMSVDTSTASEKGQALNPEGGPPISPVKLLPPTSDTSMPTPVPLLIPSIGPLNVPPPTTSHVDTALASEERLEELMKRLHLDNESQVLDYTKSTLEDIFNRCRTKVQEKAGEDIKKKLELLRDRWQQGKLSEAVKVKISQLATALKDKEMSKANQLHLSLMVDHTAEVNQWMVAVKRLIKEQEILMQESECSEKSVEVDAQKETSTDSCEQSVEEISENKDCVSSGDQTGSQSPGGSSDNTSQSEQTGSVVEQIGNAASQERNEQSTSQLSEGNVIDTTIDK